MLDSLICFNYSINSGIYQLVNEKTGDFYIGSAINLYTRERVHLSLLGRQLYPNIYLQRVWNKYGEDCFKFKVLIFCSKELCVWYEQRFLDILKPVYNLSLTANSNLGTKYNFSQLVRIKAGITL